MSEIIITNVVPAHAAAWFGKVLSDVGIPCCFELENRLTDLNLQVLNGAWSLLMYVIIWMDVDKLSLPFAFILKLYVK
jgi:hypothetical protein